MRQKSNGKFKDYRALVDAVWFHKFGTDNSHRVVARICEISPSLVTRALNSDYPSEETKKKILLAVGPGGRLQHYGIRQVDAWLTKGTKTIPQIAAELGLQRNAVEGALTRFRSIRGDRVAQKEQTEAQELLALAHKDTVELLTERFEEVSALCEKMGVQGDALAAIQDYVQEFKDAVDQGVNLTGAPNPTEFGGFLEEGPRELFITNVECYLQGGVL